MNKFHQHDCDCCHYLGSENVNDSGFDYYICEQGGSNPTVIARFGIDGDYASGLISVKYSAKDYIKNHPDMTLAEAVLELRKHEEPSSLKLIECASRAIEQGFLDENLSFKMPSNIKKMKL